MQGRDIVFLDPDKGLAPPAAGLSSTEHAYVPELEALVRARADGGRVSPPRAHRRASGPDARLAERLARELRLDVEPHIPVVPEGDGSAPISSYQPTLTPRRLGERLERSGGASGSSGGTSLRCRPLHPNVAVQNELRTHAAERFSPGRWLERSRSERAAPLE